MNVQKVNYKKELERLLKEMEAAERGRTLLIHSCGATGSSDVRE